VARVQINYEAGLSTYLEVLIADEQYHQAITCSAGGRRALPGHRGSVRRTRWRMVVRGG